MDKNKVIVVLVIGIEEMDMEYSTWRNKRRIAWLEKGKGYGMRWGEGGRGAENDGIMEGRGGVRA